MNNNAKSDVTIILDRSGSMETMRENMLKALNKMISDVKEAPGQGYWTLVEFDDHGSAKGAGEAFPHVVFEYRSDVDVPYIEPEQFVPRGGTALVDAVFKTIKQTRDRLFVQPEEDRPKVMMVIVTDGQENQSTEHTSEELRELIAKMQTKHKWEFMYLGANQDVFAETAKYNMNQANTTPGLGAGGSYAIPMPTSASGVAYTLCSGSIGLYAWKAHNAGTTTQDIADACLNIANSLPVEPVLTTTTTTNSGTPSKTTP